MLGMPQDMSIQLSLRKLPFRGMSLKLWHTTRPHIESIGQRPRVEEKFGEQNFRVLSEMQGKFWDIDPKN